MVKEFKEFILRGNVVDLAIAVIIGAAFTAIVNSLVKDIFMPIIGYALGGVDFTSMFIVLGGGHLRQPGGRAGGRRGDHQLRRVHQRHHHLPAGRPDPLLRRQGDQQAAEAAGAGPAQHQGVPALPIDDPVEGDALPRLARLSFRRSEPLLTETSF